MAVARAGVGGHDRARRRRLTAARIFAHGRETPAPARRSPFEVKEQLGLRSRRVMTHLEHPLGGI